jgi:hypothetical protein
MPTLVNCPSCDRKLRVPDDMLGTRVKCPSCGGKFDAVADSDGAAPPPLPGASDQAPPALDELEEVPEGVQSKPAAPTRPARDDEDAVQDRPSRRQRWRDEDDDEDDDRERGRYRAPPRWQGEPHRAGLVLTFGIISVSSLVVGLFAWVIFAGCSLVFCAIGLGLGIPAWIMGHKDLNKINARIMDPAGKGNTTGGYVCGIIGTLGNAIVLACCTLAVVGFLAFMGISLSGASMPKSQSKPSPVKQQERGGALPRMQDYRPRRAFPPDAGASGW